MKCPTCDSPMIDEEGNCPICGRTPKINKTVKEKKIEKQIEALELGGYVSEKDSRKKRINELKEQLRNSDESRVIHK